MLFHQHWSVSAALLLLAQIAGTSFAFKFTPTGQTVQLDGASYYIPPDVVSTISVSKPLKKALENAGGLLPFTVVHADSFGYGERDFSKDIASYISSDDVFNKGFLEAVYVQYSGTSGHKYPGFSAPKLSGNNSVGVVSVGFVSNTSSIPTGPYFVTTTGSVYEAWRLFSDFQGAFLETTIANKDGTFSVLPANVEGQSLAIAVPSRLYFTKTTGKPLAGVRLGIKDIYNIAGLRTSNGNRAWYHFYPPANKTALAVQRLIDAGAVIVGKMKTSQFANGEVATADWVDYHEPFNPRGDGYQDTSSSSSGPGAGAAAYDWLDLTLGSDTGGSIRNPSQVQGIFGNRPTWGMVSLEGVMPMAPEMDTAGFLTRHPDIWIAASKVLYGENVTLSYSYPSKIQTIDWPTSNSSEADGLLLSFLDKLTTFLNATSTPLNLTQQWSETHPSNVTSSLIDMMNITYPILIGQQTSSVRDPFYADYSAANSGRLPFVNPVPLARWGWAASFPPPTVGEAITNKTTFGNWIEETVFVANEQTCSETLGLYVGNSGTTTYRNAYRSPPGIPTGFSTSRISIFSGVPDFVLPIGQAAYKSNITLQTEYLPVSVDILAAKGCDGMIFGLVQDLVKAGVLTSAKAGYSGVTGEQILF
ncbi:amidase signature enzyme [Aureobasidium sp. EXF-12298]|nr:amidase signature enzyme [Aureobasidium sp. EXF-12298]KAI4766684.1 amidase signature enzyme [Aureobasidium sp. EXF-12344]KAI4784552.1 amidase signature enzyme [Aureobasidium sp. EXF-3400]